MPGWRVAVDVIKPIETHYKGYRFRSRLEARWAIYFDVCGIKWEYEREGFDLGRLGPYLPDFWLPQVQMWAEVKAQEFTKAERAKCRALARYSKTCVLMLDGSPDNKWYTAIEPNGDEVEYGVTDHHAYHTTENRFYCSPGCPTPADEGVLTDNAKRAIVAARSARFEHGETP